MNIRTSAAAFALTAFPFAVMTPAIAGGPTEPAVEPVPVAQAAPAFSSLWSGGYAGAQLGWGWADRSGDGDINSFGDRIDATTDTFRNIGSDGDGVIGGIHGGYLWNSDRFVYGGEADINFGDIELDNNVGSVDRTGSIKAKAGYDLGRTLIYATAGTTYAEADIGNTDFSDWGWNAGAGVDYLVTDTVSVGAEALYNDFGEFDNSGTDLSLTTLVAKVSYRF
ncbi:outer membrane protein [Meridianimarinicoccus sp. RP-17]|uniref:outer membrane protein n=1 Tax=Meridianimarinicoccus zhengii TaxID=2056810 RepID=UPI0013A709F1|nr:outer membrane beta-barrel protein [Phycocomes zhengii]